MKITIERYKDDGNTTLGLLFVDGKFVCYTVEDTYRDTKVAGKTRIPAGHYDVKLRNEGGLTQKYAEKFPDMHKGMLWLQDVPGFEWVYFHIGNTSDNSAGCILCTSTVDETTGFGGKSTDAYRKFYTLVADAAERGYLRVCIIDRDRQTIA